MTKLHTALKHDEYYYWIDARHYASDRSYERGYCWITEKNDCYAFIISENIEDEPADYLAEFIDGIGQ